MPHMFVSVTGFLYNYIRQFKISCTIVRILGNCYSNKYYYLLFIRNIFGTFDCGDLDLMLPMMDVWTKFKEGR